MKLKAIGLVVLRDGQVEVYGPEHVEIQVVDLDHKMRIDPPDSLPAGLGFEDLCIEAGLEYGKDYTFDK